MIDLGRPFGAGYHPARAYVLHKVLYGLLAFDLWIVMVEHGGRYGTGGFNVAHFAFLDALLPVPTPAGYVGLLLALGLLAAFIALASAPRWVRMLVAAGYTASWAISLQDSYQHHYLLSWLLAWSCFVPDVSSAAARQRGAELARGFGLPMTAITCSIVYAFTAIAKSEPEWRSGAVLMRLSKTRPPGSARPGVLDPMRDLLMSAGLDIELAWRCIAASVIALQVCVAVGYLASIARDERSSRARGFLTGLALIAALSFHAFAELGELFDIGWFSYYMLGAAFALLAPSVWVATFARLIGAPGVRLEAALSRAERFTSRPLLVVQLFAAAALLVVVGMRLDLPGARWACESVAALVLLRSLCEVARGLRVSAERNALALFAVAFAFWLSITQTHVRFDYYRRAGGELRRLGELESALDHYRKANMYAPPGRSRADVIQKLESELRDRGNYLPQRL